MTRLFLQWVLCVPLLVTGLKIKDKQEHASKQALSASDQSTEIHHSFRGHGMEEAKVGDNHVQKGNDDVSAGIKDLRKDAEDYYKSIMNMTAPGAKQDQPQLDKIKSYVAKHTRHSLQSISKVDTGAKEKAQGLLELKDSATQMSSATYKSFMESDAMKFGKEAVGLKEPDATTTKEVLGAVADFAKDALRNHEGAPWNVPQPLYNLGCALADLYFGNMDTEMAKKKDEKFVGIDPTNYWSFPYENLCLTDQSNFLEAAKFVSASNKLLGWNVTTFKSQHLHFENGTLKDVEVFVYPSPVKTSDKFVVFPLPPHWRAGVYDTQRGPVVLTIAGLLRTVLGATVIVMTGAENKDFEISSERGFYKDVSVIVDDIYAGKYGGSKNPNKLIAATGLSYGASMGFNAIFDDRRITAGLFDGIFWNQRNIINHLHLQPLNQMGKIGQGLVATIEATGGETGDGRFNPVTAAGQLVTGLVYTCLKNRNHWCVERGGADAHYMLNDCESPHVNIENVKPNLTGTSFFLINTEGDMVTDEKQLTDADTQLTKFGGKVTTWIGKLAPGILENPKCRTHSVLSLYQTNTYWKKMKNFFVTSYASEINAEWAASLPDDLPCQKECGAGAKDHIEEECYKCVSKWTYGKRGYQH